MEEAFFRTMLFDFYGELLTEKQRTYCELSCNQDLSLAEIADLCGISRQGVHDALSHAEASLRGFEKALGCAERDALLRERVEAAAGALGPLLSHADPAVRAEAQRVEAAIKTILE